MEVINSRLKEVFVIEPKVYGDHRGWFTETYSKKVLEDYGINTEFVQDNHSFSAKKGTLRGLHYQMDPKAQAKLVRCTKGAIFDVAVDIRKGSPTYGEWFGIELSAENKKQLFVPKGFAHGFMTLTDNVEVQYKVDENYSPENERSILWNDPVIGIKWPMNIKPVLSVKDDAAPLLDDADNNFMSGE
ncbi:dTDP-4-dehydrorhamnose 3,5-epimerase [Oceanobacillus sp. Castelsardo]|uniref:dTDP-4-dehydrorhamnose 3,5-epimerase n=1 Tax=Oceanobacillus sp. Castelsardo TaxID=1851204 RepID=UPI0008397C53|nr:dTDP-4-dehydrorhamnose 3,5-epimerase [Oceanobacillus sp. Castelsardo]